MTERTGGEKGVVRVFGYDPEAPAYVPPPKLDPVEQSKRDVEDYIKGMGGPWFIPPCFAYQDFVVRTEKIAAERRAREWAEAWNRAIREGWDD